MYDKKTIQVFIAEDDYLAGELIKEMVKDLGHQVLEKVSTGVQAINKIQELVNNNQKPDVVILDIKMPELDGIEAAKQIVKICPVPIVLLTAYQTPELVKKASLAGIGAYLVKPPRLQELDRAITITMARFEDMMELKKLNEELKEALEKVKTLSGLLPICAHCKKIRDDDGYWQDVAVYIRNHSEAEFTHGICPDCAKEYFE
ncbi:MAG: response regulator [Spirochaetes bacterium]|nr:response regulator [Spirochaetota bacterium]